MKDEICQRKNGGSAPRLLVNNLCSLYVFYVVDIYLTHVIRKESTYLTWNTVESTHKPPFQWHLKLLCGSLNLSKEGKSVENKK